MLLRKVASGLKILIEPIKCWQMANGKLTLKEAIKWALMALLRNRQSKMRKFRNVLDARNAGNKEEQPWQSGK